MHFLPYPSINRNTWCEHLLPFFCISITLIIVYLTPIFRTSLSLLQKRFKEIMKFLTIYVEFEICKLVVFASTRITMLFACKGGLTLCDVLKFFSRPFSLTLCNVVELSFQSLPSTLQRKKIPFQKTRIRMFKVFKKLKKPFT